MIVLLQLVHLFDNDDNDDYVDNDNDDYDENDDDDNCDWLATACAPLDSEDDGG